MSEMSYTYEEVEYLLSVAARTRHHKVFTCAPDVIEMLGERIPPPDPDPDPVFLPELGAVSQLMAVPIIVDEDLEPGQFRLVRHSGCSVNISTREVHHGLCPVTASGVVTG